MVDWIYKYIDRNQTCYVFGENDRASDKILTLKLNSPPRILLENETYGSFSGVQIFGIVVIVFISIFAAIVVIRFLWNKTYVRV